MPGQVFDRFGANPVGVCQARLDRLDDAPRERLRNRVVPAAQLETPQRFLVSAGHPVNILRLEGGALQQTIDRHNLPQLEAPPATTTRSIKSILRSHQDFEKPTAP